MRKIMAVLMGLVLSVAVSQAAVNVTWFAGSAAGIVDQTGAALAPGSIVQLINAGLNGEMDALDATTEGFVGGDDSIVATTAVFDGGDGNSYFFVSGTRYDSVAQTDSLFIRAFNSADLTAVTTDVWYGQGGLRTSFANPDATPKPPADSVIWGAGAQTIATGEQFLIPEPSSILLALAGALMLVRKLRK